MAYAGRSPQSVLKQRYFSQISDARRRPVTFNLTFEQWVWVWERALGPDWARMIGNQRGGYCMARFGDRGGYELGNVVIKLSAENRSEGKTGRYNFSELNGILSLPT